MNKEWTVCARRTVVVLGCALTLPLSSSPAGAAQTAATLSQVKKVYVGSLGEKKGSSELRDALLKRLRSVRGLQVVSTQVEADAVITGSGELWIKGYYTTSPRPSPYGQNPIYGGALSVEIKGKDAETLWSYLVTPSKFHWGAVTEDLADHLVKKFQQALQESAAKGASH
jgi:hypothetical protein